MNLSYLYTVTKSHTEMYNCSLSQIFVIRCTMVSFVFDVN